MAKISLTNLSSPYIASGVTTYNANLAAIAAALENTLSRDGTTPNFMSADLDLNGNDIFNIRSLTATNITGTNFTFDYITVNNNLTVTGDLTVGGYNVYTTNTLDLTPYATIAYVDATKVAAEAVRDAAQESATAAEAAALSTASDLAAVVAARDEVEADRVEVAANRDLTYGYQQSAASAVAYQNLATIAATKAVTAVAICVYDTSLDNDGGAWRKRCTGTTWYNETLNTATRGARREFPAVAVIVAESNKLTIYDGDDPTLPMWMVINAAVAYDYLIGFGTNGALTGVVARNGNVIVCSTSDTSNQGVNALFKLSLIDDECYRYSGVGLRRWTKGLATRAISPAVSWWYNAQTDVAKAIVGWKIADCAVTVMPDAPIHPVTGLPEVTIAVATEAGISVIRHDGTVVDIVNYVTAPTTVAFVSIGEKPRLAVQSRNANWMSVLDVLAADVNLSSYIDSLVIDGASASFKRFADTKPAFASSTGAGFKLFAKSDDFVGDTKTMTASAPMQALIRTNYNTGWQPRGIKGALLASKDTASLVGGTDADRSINNTGLTVNGTIARAQVAAGADLVGYSGFSAANYLEQPYNSGLDFGTGAFSIIGNFKEAPNSALETLVERQSAAAAAGFKVQINASGYLLFTVTDGTTTRTATGTRTIDDSVWHSFVAYYDGSGGVYLYVDGALYASATGAALLTNNNAAAKLRLGLDAAGAYPLTNGSLALVRVAASAPSADQIRKIYEDERRLFLPGAICTTYGASDDIKAIAADPKTGLLHVGTSSGLSTFDGLLRVAADTTPVTTALAVVDGMMMRQ